MTKGSGVNIARRVTFCKEAVMTLAELIDAGLQIPEDARTMLSPRCLIPKEGVSRSL